MQPDEFEWDAGKARSNISKHGVSFEAALHVFDDLFALDRADPGGSGEEARFVIAGMVNGMLLTVVYTERSNRTRIISARKATKHEQRDYYSHQTRE